MKKKIAVIGGGAAGMFAALNAAERGCEVHLFEKNEKLGKKIYITGKGRCNLTNACDTEELFQAVVSNPKFLYCAFYGYTNHDVIDSSDLQRPKLNVETVFFRYQIILQMLLMHFAGKCGNIKCRCI